MNCIQSQKNHRIGTGNEHNYVTALAINICKRL